MKKIISTLNAIFDRALDTSLVLVAILLVFVMLFVSLEITTRSFLGSSIYGVVDLTEIALLLITFLGAAWVLRRNKHVKIEIVIDRFSIRARIVIRIITSIVAACVCLVLTITSTQATWDSFLRGVTIYKALVLPRAPVMAVIPLGSFLLFVQFLRNTHGYLQQLSSLDKTQK